MTRYVAFLRGINVGKARRIKMEDLRAAFESMGFAKVRTYIASGNVIFEAPETDMAALTRTIEEGLASAFGFDIGVALRTGDAIAAMVAGDPFSGIEVTPDTRLYVTFLREPPASSLPIPYESPDGSYRIFRVADGAVFSVLTLSEGNRTPDAMKILEKEFGRDVTTRNWNMLTKLSASYL